MMARTAMKLDDSKVRIGLWLLGAVALALQARCIIADSMVMMAGEEANLICHAQSQAQLDSTVWTKDGLPISRGTVSTSPSDGDSSGPDSLASILTLEEIGSSDVGLYECAGMDEEEEGTMVVLFGTYLFVEDVEKLIVEPTDGQRLVNVKSRGSAVVPCRPSFPDVELTLVRGVTQMPVNLDSAGMTFDPKVGFVIGEGKLKHHNGVLLCKAAWGNATDSEVFTLIFSFAAADGEGLPPPEVTLFQEEPWSVGKRQELECKVEDVPRDISLRWVTPALMSGEVEVVADEYSMEGGRVTVTKTISSSGWSRRSKFGGSRMGRGGGGMGNVDVISRAVIDPVALGDQGDYSCKVSRSGMEPRSVSKTAEVVQPSSPLEWDTSAFNPGVVSEEGGEVKWVVGLRVHGFHPRIEWFGPDRERIANDDVDWKYSFDLDDFDDSDKDKLKLVCIIRDVGAADMGKYELRVTDSEDLQHSDVLGKLAMALYVKAAPLVSIAKDRSNSEGGKLLHDVDEESNLRCSIKAYPMESAIIEVSMRDCNKDCSTLFPYERKLKYQVEKSDGLSEATLLIDMSGEAAARRSGLVTCGVCSEAGECAADQVPFLLTDLQEPITVVKTVEEGSGVVVSLSCRASIMLFSSLTWWRRQRGDEDFHILGTKAGEKGDVEIEEISDWSSISSNLTFDNFSPSLNGMYRCVGETRADSSSSWALAPWMEDVDYETTSAQQRLSARIPTEPVISGASFKNGDELHLQRDEDETLYCTAEGYPEPTLRWMKDGREIDVGSGSSSGGFHVTPDGKRLTIKPQEVDARDLEGEYSCRAENRLGVAEFLVQATVKKDSAKTAGIVSGTIISFCLILIVGMVIYYRAKLKRAKSRLPRKDVERMKQGDPDALKMMQEGAQEDEKAALIVREGNANMLPYPKELDFPLNKLTFGSQIGAGQFGRVLKAQAREIIPRESVTTVAVKMLKFPAGMDDLNSLMNEIKIMAHVGKHPNLLNILGACTEKLDMRELYAILEYCHLGNLLQILTKNRRIYRPNIMTQSMSLGKPITPKFSPVPTSEGRYTDFPLTALDSISSSSFDYRPEEEFLTKGDLFTWALHVAKGMEYLSARQFLHGDLACRNILIAEDGTAKISDFGLSKNIYHSQEYRKQSDKPLPVKWLAPESIRDQVFSTPSDVWSYGIILWEMFSLGAVPYPGMEPSLRLYEFLMRGERMRCPDHTPGYVYDIMLGCWQTRPEDRLSFDRIVTLLVREIRLSAYPQQDSTPTDPDTGFLVQGAANNVSYLRVAEPSQQQLQGSGPSTASELDSEGYLICLKSPPPAN